MMENFELYKLQSLLRLPSKWNGKMSLCHALCVSKNAPNLDASQLRSCKKWFRHNENSKFW